MPWPMASEAETAAYDNDERKPLPPSRGCDSGRPNVGHGEERSFNTIKIYFNASLSRAPAVSKKFQMTSTLLQRG